MSLTRMQCKPYLKCLRTYHDPWTPEHPCAKSSGLKRKNQLISEMFSTRPQQGCRTIRRKRTVSEGLNQKTAAMGARWDPRSMVTSGDILCDYYSFEHTQILLDPNCLYPGRKKHVFPVSYLCCWDLFWLLNSYWYVIQRSKSAWFSTSWRVFSVLFFWPAEWTERTDVIAFFWRVDI